MSFSVIEWSILFLLFLYLILLLTYIYGWLKLKNFHAISQTNYTTVSIIIPARNEEDHIADCLNAITSQKYPTHLVEIIVVNDNSEDGTLKKIEEYKKKNNNIKLLDLKHSQGKKMAITHAMQEARFELIVTTDADCKMGEEWLRTIVSYYEMCKPKLIAGPVALEYKKNIFQKFQCVEFLALIGVSAASIANKRPIMCNGANLAYPKKIFNEVGGYNSIGEPASGDDVFLMLKIADKYPKGVHFVKSAKAIVYTDARNSILEFFQQRKRWASKTFKYKTLYVTIISVIVYFLNFSITLSLLLSIIYPSANWLSVFFIQILSKSSVELLFLWLVAGFFNKRKLLLLFLPEQLLYFLYITLMGIMAPFGKYNWKGRKIK